MLKALTLKEIERIFTITDALCVSREALVIPLFPHYAMSSFESAAERVKEDAARIAPQMRVHVQPPFFEQPDYIDALVASATDPVDDEARVAPEVADCRVDLRQPDAQDAMHRAIVLPGRRGGGRA